MNGVLDNRILDFGVDRGTLRYVGHDRAPVPGLPMVHWNDRSS
jgi:hypothetical protein